MNIFTAFLEGAVGHIERHRIEQDARNAKWQRKSRFWMTLFKAGPVICSAGLLLFSTAAIRAFMYVNSDISRSLWWDAPMLGGWAVFIVGVGWMWLCMGMAQRANNKQAVTFF